jgi:uncharacterized protein with PIN domain
VPVGHEAKLPISIGIVKIKLGGRSQGAGKGRHPAGLSLGDCLTYAVARLAGRPLLFAGGDFAKTDLPAA